MAIVLTLLAGLGLLGLASLAAGPRPAAGGPPDPETIRRWLATNPLPSEIDEVAGQLAAAGYTETAATLRGLAQQARERPQQPGEALPPPPAPGTPPPAPVLPVPLDNGGGAGPAAAPSPGPGLSEAERAQLAGLPPDVVAEVTEYVMRQNAPQGRAAVFAALQAIRARGTTLSASEREQTAQMLASNHGLPQLAAWLRSVRAATPEGGAPSSTPQPTPATPTAAPPSPETARPGYAVRTAAFDADGARKLAPRVASDIKTRTRNYSREALAEFQRAAGIVADGVYGGETRGALVFYGVRDAPGAMFRPTNTVAYHPPA